MEHLAREKGLTWHRHTVSLTGLKWKETAIEKALHLYAVNKAETESTGAAVR